MTRVVFVSSHAELGGSERYLLDLVTHLPPGAVAGVVCLADGPLVAKLRAAGAPVSVVPTGAGLPSLTRRALTVRRLLHRHEADVVHANGIKAALVCALAWVRTPLVWAKHDFSWDGPLARAVAARCTIVVGVSRVVLRGLSRDKATVVMPGVSLGVPDRAAGRAALEQLTGSSAAVVALVGRLHPVKGHRELIEAAPAVRARVPGARFLFVGGTDDRQAGYAREIAGLTEARLGAAAVWAGHREDLPDLLAACSAVVIVTGSDERAPRGEGFGYVALEAMAAGAPVVAYDNGAVGEVVGDCGVLVPPGDRDALVAAVVRVLEDQHERDELAGCGADRVATEFALARFVADMERVYGEAAR